MKNKRQYAVLFVVAGLLAGCQTSGSTSTQGPKAGSSGNPPPRVNTTGKTLPNDLVSGRLAAIVNKVSRPGPILLHGGGGGRTSDESDPLIPLSFALSAQTATPGTQPTICLIEAAAPEAKPYEETVDPDGARFIHLGITPENPASKGLNTQVSDAIRRCTGFYFAGGDPARLSISLLERNGADTPALAAIRQRHAQGALIFGASAGAMMASKTMLCECGAGSSLEALTSGHLKLAPGLRFTPNVLMDAHFIERGLIGRLVEAMRVTKENFALGLDENTSVLMPGDGSPWLILGESGAITVRQTDPERPYDELEINLLAVGDSYDPQTRAVTIAPERQPIGPSQSSDTIIPEVFEPGGFSKLLRLAALNTYGRAAGLSKIAALANVRVTVTRTPETRVYFSPKLPLDRAYSITGLRLRINAPITRRGAS